MGRKITDKILRKMKIETLRKIVQYRNSSNITIKSGAITNIDQMEFLNGDVVSQGNDPKMFVYFYKPIKKLHIEYQIESKDKNDTFELFFSDVKKKKVDFSYDECYKIGRLDDREYHRNIIFKTPVKHLRIDLGQHSGDIKLKKMVLTPLKGINEYGFDEYTNILDSIHCNSWIK